MMQLSRRHAAMATACLACAALTWLTPSFVTPVDTQMAFAPAAGVAFAAGAHWGRIAIPGLLLGTWIGSGAPINASAAALLLATFLQAAAGCLSLRQRMHDGTFRLEDARSVLQLLLAPVCLTATVCAIPQAVLAGAQAGPVALVTIYLVRVASDAVGMLLAAPVVFTLVASPAGDWRQRRFSLGVPLTMLAILLQLGLAAASRWDEERGRSQFEHRARAATAEVERQVQAATNAIDALHGAALATNGRLTPERFDALALPWLQNASATVEAGILAASPNSVAPVHFMARDGHTSTVMLGDGLDLLSIPATRGAALSALRGGPIRATAPYALAESPEKGTLVSLMRPYRLDDGSIPGMVFVTVRLGALFEATAGISGAPSLCAIAQDAGGWTPIRAGEHCNPFQADGSHVFEYMQVLEVAGSRWQLSARQPAAHALRADGLWSVWLFALPALPCAAVLALVLILVTGRAQREARRLAQTVLSAAASEQDLRCVFETATVGLVQSGPDQLIINANPAFCRLTRYELAELRRMRILDLTPPEEHQQDLAAWTALRSGSQPTVRRGNKHYRRSDGVLVPVSVTVSAIRDANGQLRFTVGSVQDISDSVRLGEAERVRDRAEAASKAKSAFVANISHELRTPLNAILGFAQLIAGRSAGTDPQAQAWLGRLQGAGWHLLAMINDLLDLSRIEGGQLRIQTSDVDLTMAVDASLAMVNETALRRGITIHCVLDEHAQSAHADPVRLRQVLINLLSNAVKYNIDGGEIWIRSRRATVHSIEIDVTDTGLGLSAEQLRLLFQPFNRLGRESSRIDGTGIGLVISKRLAEMMGGNLGARSVAGRGSTFTLTIPSAPEGCAPRRSDPEAEDRPTNAYAARCVLYVEDNETNIEIMRAMLAQRPQVRLVVARTAGEAFSCLARRSPQLVLLDRHLPDMDGIAMLRRLRAATHTSNLPVVIVSAEAAESQVAEAIASGASDYLTKPITLGSLLSMVDRFLESADTCFDVAPQDDDGSDS